MSGRDGSARGGRRRRLPIGTDSSARRLRTMTAATTAVPNYPSHSRMCCRKRSARNRRKRNSRHNRVPIRMTKPSDTVPSSASRRFSCMCCASTVTTRTMLLATSSKPLLMMRNCSEYLTTRWPRYFRKLQRTLKTQGTQTTVHPRRTTRNDSLRRCCDAVSCSTTTSSKRIWIRPFHPMPPNGRSNAAEKTRARRSGHTTLPMRSRMRSSRN